MLSQEKPNASESLFVSSFATYSFIFYSSARADSQTRNKRGKMLRKYMERKLVIEITLIRNWKKMAIPHVILVRLLESHEIASKENCNQVVALSIEIWERVPGH